MKKFLLPLAFGLLTSHTFATNLYCTPTGAGNHNGLSFANAINPSTLFTYINNNIIIGELNIFFSRGIYTDSYYFDANTIPTTITNINIYGGFHDSINLVSNSLDYIQRNLPTDETVFWIKNGPAFAYCCSWFSGTINIIDGITFRSNEESLNYPVMELYNGDHIISHCKIKDIATEGPLLWLESGNSYKCIVNSVIENDTADYMLPAFCNLDIINCTIAENEWQQCFIYANLQNKSYGIFNSIILKNSTLGMGSINEYVDVSYSILDYYDSYWMHDDGTNYWGYDPFFTFLTPDIHTCYSTSIAINAGYAPYLTSLPFSSPFNLAFYEVNMHPRFYYSYSVLDIGAYQHLYDNHDPYYHVYEYPAPPRSQSSIKEMESFDTQDNFNVLGQRVDDTYHGIVIRNGKKVLQ